jgi:hypothetical protein
VSGNNDGLLGGKWGNIAPNRAMNRVTSIPQLIDCLVYKLYNLTDEEIKIIESSTG